MKRSTKLLATGSGLLMLFVVMRFLAGHTGESAPSVRTGSLSYEPALAGGARQEHPAWPPRSPPEPTDLNAAATDPKRAAGEVDVATEPYLASTAARPEDAGIQVASPSPEQQPRFIWPAPNPESPVEAAHREALAILSSLHAEVGSCVAGQGASPGVGDLSDPRDVELLVEFETAWEELRILAAPLRRGGAPNARVLCAQNHLRLRRFPAANSRPGLRLHVSYHPPI